VNLTLVENDFSEFPREGIARDMRHARERTRTAARVAALTLLETAASGRICHVNLFLDLFSGSTRPVFFVEMAFRRLISRPVIGRCAALIPKGVREKRGTADGEGFALGLWAQTTAATLGGVKG
jgi:hypothetical protein